MAVSSYNIDFHPRFNFLFVEVCVIDPQNHLRGNLKLPYQIHS
jgi:hypothetical protein